MASVLSSVAWPARPQPSPRSSVVGRLSSLYSSSSNADADEPDLRELNAGLQALVDLFPDIQPEVFREMLSSFSEESRLEVITETLLKHSAKWIRGRYRTPNEDTEQQTMSRKYKYRPNQPAQDTRGKPLAIEDTFRSRSYRNAAKATLYKEFSGLSHSTIKAVLAEYNWSYTQARPTLLGLSSKSWRASIISFFSRRKPPSAQDHPLVIWTQADAKTGRPAQPFLVKTENRELDQELYDTLIVPELDKQRAEQLAHDRRLALELNEAEAEEAEEMYDCECCFIPNTLEQMSTCSSDGHYICFRCIRHSINAALYDQGWSRNIDTRRCTLRCIAPLADGVEDCPGCIPFEFVERALLEEKDGEDTCRKLNERFTSDALTKSRLPLICCPFCSYAELDYLALSGPDLYSSLKLRRGRIFLVSIPFCFHLVRVAFQILAIILGSLALFKCWTPQPFHELEPVKSALRRIQLKRRGLRFNCLSPTCGRASCLSCSAPWHDPHECYSSQLQSLRLTLERATTDAIKRTCPNCNLGFVKSEGCNKLVCLCGYSMCYVCREGLGKQGYQHFCQHFRAQPGTRCTECDKCDLYRTEDEDVVVKRARATAEREWWEKQGGNSKETLQKGVSGELDRLREKEKVKVIAKGLKWESWLESLLEFLIE